MKVHVKDIKAEGIEVVESIASDDIGISSKDAIYFVEPVKITAWVSCSSGGRWREYAMATKKKKLC